MIYNSESVEMLGFFTCTCTKYHQLLLQDSTAVRVVWENPEPFSVLAVQGLKLELLLLIT